ncbi:MAG: right-handed parallel beta-helix repeat-containing protein [Candidatus Heimdallarchaeaceae archaeon]
MTFEKGNFFMIEFLEQKNPLNLSQVNSSPIIITSDSNFTDYGFSGSGTKELPFLIQSLNIETSEEIGIYIFNTTKYFLIQGCLVNASKNGIVLDSVKEKTSAIINNICRGNSIRGIQIYNSEYSEISNNICESNGFFGIHVRNSSNLIIKDNYCLNNGAGLFVDLSNNSTIEDNVCNWNIEGGIIVEDSHFSIILENRCDNNDRLGGIDLFGSYNSTVIRNICTNNLQTNIRIGESNNSIVKDNFCSGLGSGIVSTDGENVTLEKNTCVENIIGIYVKNAKKSRIIDNNLVKSGFKFHENNIANFGTHIVSNNLVNGKKLGYFVNQTGLSIRDSEFGQIFIVDCDNIVIKNQNLTETTTGLSLLYSSNCFIKNTKCSFNWNYGMNLVESMGNRIIDSNCSYNFVGILAESSDFNELKYNNFENNQAWGIVLDFYSSNNFIHHNSFIDNNLELGIAQAKDDGKNNTWFEIKTKEGNFWSDHTFDMKTYLLDGLANSQDLYPLSKPPTHRSNLVYFYFLAIICIIPIFLMIYHRLRKKPK